MKILAAAAGLAIIATSALAADEEKAPPTAEAPKKPEPKVCKTEKVTGSLARKRRICMTREEWDQLAANTKKGIDDYGRGAAGAPKCIGLNCDQAPGM